ncbi:transcription-associated protein TFIIS [Methanocaldococcus villosus KIN24-T80]|uniref:Transcription factor S n=1 Tax=Methanocaldococcus villosus KIN24-T80 TaxID=1069083 RepID=N6VZ68_9EURY|nr:transcription factor S [Methanocaldococcus villosus]ENN96422.1 transcription-associated protein TFIIS [Methanocaldococcus villosus KIN24-T80]
MVKFCPKCNNIMLPKNGMLVCAVCGYVEEASEDSKKEYEYKEQLDKKKEITIIEGKEMETLPTTRAECPKCGHKEAYWWMQQTRCADEPETRFYKCKKCGHTWREYD